MHLRRSLSALALLLVSAPTLALAEGPEAAKPAAPEPSTEYEGRVSFVFRPSFPVSNGNVFANSMAGGGIEWQNGGGLLRYHAAAMIVGTIDMLGARLEPLSFGLGFPIYDKGGARVELEPVLHLLNPQLVAPTDRRGTLLPNRGDTATFQLSTGADVRVNFSKDKFTFGLSPIGFDVRWLNAGLATGAKQELLAGVDYQMRVTLGYQYGGVEKAEHDCPDGSKVALDKECPKAVAKDSDKDGIPDDEDACRDVAGPKTDDPKTNGCPPDADGDGIADKDDACPDKRGPRTTDPKTNGCPLATDADGDGVTDKEDACPSVAGIASADPKTNGCPDPDPDKDGVLGDKDACPNEAGKPDPDPTKNGCPKAFVQGGLIKILDQVKFQTGSSAIAAGKDNDDTLQAVVNVLQKHPEIKMLSVEGHTDNKGYADQNKKLSAARAASVVDALVKKGIAKERLSSVGFGQEKPIASNDTEAGRKDNRRVEFHIVNK
jgi:outer membrane protein OmpA-like peptidoglycan-associated protein